MPFAKYLYHLSSTLFYKQLYNFVSTRKDIPNLKKSSIFQQKKKTLKNPFQAKIRFLFFTQNPIRLSSVIGWSCKHIFSLRWLCIFISWGMNTFFICEQMRPIFISKSHLDRNINARSHWKWMKLCCRNRNGICNVCIVVLHLSLLLLFFEEPQNRFCTCKRMV